jgi:hypothetical protein
MTVLNVLALLVAAALALGLTLRLRARGDTAAVLRLMAFLLALVGAAAVFPATVQDSGAFAFWGLGLPVLVTVAPLLAARLRFGAVVTGLAAGFLLLWTVLLALGVGLFLLPAALAETAAAVAQRRPRTHERDLTGATSGG